MKNRTFEAIKKGQEVATEELFDLVNAYNYADLVVQDENNLAIVKISVNHFAEYGNKYEFSQAHSDNGSYIIKKSDLVSAETDYREDMDILFIKCQIINGKKLALVIFNASTNFKATESDEYYEIDLENLEDFLRNISGNEAKYYCTCTRFIDKNGMNIKIKTPRHIYLDEEDDLGRKLHICNSSAEFEFLVTDDECNAFYWKKDGDTVEILIKPCEQPFAEIRIVFYRK